MLLGSVDSVRGYGLCCLRCLGEWILSSRALGHSGTKHEAGCPFDAVVMVNSGRIPVEFRCSKPMNHINMGVSENRDHPIVPNGFADQTIPF